MDSEMERRAFLRNAAAGTGGLGLLAQRGTTAAAEPKPAPWPFYAFDNGLRTVRTIEAKVKLLKDLGYDGIEYHLNHAQLPKMVAALDKHGLKLYGVYSVPMLESPVDPRLADSVKAMAAHPTRIELAIRSKKHRPSDPAGDATAIEMMKRVSDLCGDAGPMVSIYPHTGFWTERVDDGVRLAKAVGRKNVGTHFNLVHWTSVKQPRPLDEVLKESLPHLLCVTINNGTTKGRKIYALDKGDYDLLGFLRLARTLGYTGPVGLQCYSVPGPSEEHLKRSMDTWRELLRKL